MKNLKTYGVLGLLLAAGLTGPLMAETAPAKVNKDTVVAKINGMNITEGDLDLARIEMFNQISNVPVTARRKILVEYLIENILLADAAKKQGLEKSTDYQNLVKYYDRKALRDSYFNKEIVGGVSDTEIKKTYEDAAAESEVNASHILVKTEEEAKAVYGALKKGGDFAKLAKEKTLDPGSKEKGGELGFFRKGQMVPAFEKAAYALAKPGDLSEPIKSRFGWHIIKLNEKRKRKLPPFKDVAPRIKSHLQTQKASKLLEDLRKAAKIEMIDKELAKPLNLPRGSN